MGMAMRSGAPLALDLAPIFWRALLEGEDTVAEEDISTYDPILMNYVKTVQEIQTEAEFDAFLEEQSFPKFVHTSLDGREVELTPNGSKKYVTFKNKQDYTDQLVKLRLRELKAKTRFECIREGLATLTPFWFLRDILGPKALEKAVCGEKTISWEALKANTKYAAGLSQENEQVERFWSVLATFSPLQMEKFVRFASNQARLPSNGHFGPMILAGTTSDDGQYEDERYVRAETCMFMVKLPKYSSEDVMREKILFAINFAADPLSG